MVFFLEGKTHVKSLACHLVQCVGTCDNFTRHRQSMGLFLGPSALILVLGVRCSHSPSPCRTCSGGCHLRLLGRLPIRSADGKWPRWVACSMQPGWPDGRHCHPRRDGHRQYHDRARAWQCWHGCRAGRCQQTAPAEKRTLALGMVTSLGSFGQFALVPLTQVIILDFGWQTAMLTMSVVAASMIAIGLGLRGPTAQPA